MSRIYDMEQCGCNSTYICLTHRFVGRKPPSDCPDADLMAANDEIVMTELLEAREEVYPCTECGVQRTKAEGGTTFTVCDVCWDKKHTDYDDIYDQGAYFE